MNGLSICSGVGLLDLAVAAVLPGYRTAAYIEQDPYCQNVRAARMRDGGLDPAPLWPDLRTFDPAPWAGKIDILHGGIPCVAWSVAGKQRRGADPRHLWPAVLPLLDAIRPPLLFIENVRGFLRGVGPADGVSGEAADVSGLGEVLGSVAERGYDATWGVFSAADVGAPHRRQRVFILAMANDDGDQRTWAGGPDDAGRTLAAGAGRGLDLGHADEPRLEGRGGPLGGGGDERLAGTTSAALDLPAWPPGPTEREQWADILAIWPGLAPAIPAPRRVVHASRSRRGGIDGGNPHLGRGQDTAGRHAPLADAAQRSARDTRSRRDTRGAANGHEAQREFRGVAPRRAPWLDPRDRTARLRALGNAVVPAQAAYALLILWARLMGPDGARAR